MSKIMLVVSLIRGLVAIGLGLFLLFIPARTGPMVANLLGIFWLFSGVAMLRRNRQDPLVQTMGHRTNLIIAVAAIVAGLAVVTRHLSVHVLPRELLVALLGVVIGCSGVLHLIGIMRTGGITAHLDRFLHFTMALLEILLGLALVFSPPDRNPAMYILATIWTLAFGVLIIGQAVIAWRRDSHTVEDHTVENHTA